MRDIKSILKYAYEVEKRGQNFYSENAKMMKNDSARKVFEELAKMEDEHKQYIRDYAKVFNIELENEENATQRHFEKRFEEVSPKTSLETDLGDLAALRLAYLIEHDLADFYRRAAEKVEEEKLKIVLERLAYWEDEHERMIKEEYDEIMQRAWADAEFYPF